MGFGVEMNPDRIRGCRKLTPDGRSGSSGFKWRDRRPDRLDDPSTIDRIEATNDWDPTRW